MPTFFQRRSKLLLAADVTTMTIRSFVKGTTGALILEGAGYSLVNHSYLLVGSACGLGALIGAIPILYIHSRYIPDLFINYGFIHNSLSILISNLVYACIGAAILNTLGMMALSVSAVAITSLVFPSIQVGLLCLNVSLLHDTTPTYSDEALGYTDNNRHSMLS